MPGPRLMLACDAVDIATDFLAGVSTSASAATVRRVINEAYEEIGQEFDWSFLTNQYRIALQAVYSTGTIAYTHSTRTVTLTNGDFPSWAAGAVIRISGVPSVVTTRSSSTSLVLDTSLNPGQNVAAGTSYQLFPRCYALPSDFVSAVRPWNESIFTGAEQVSYDEFLQLERYYEDTGDARWFCIRGMDDAYGQLGLFVFPPSSEAKTLDLIYRRRPREIRYWGDSEQYKGTVSVGSGSVNVTGSGTAFAEAMVGSIIRLSSNANRPTSRSGLNPFAEERSIAGWASTTSVTLDSGAAAARSGVGYVVSDVIDLEVAHHNAFAACIRRRLAYERSVKSAAEYLRLYEMELQKAKANNHQPTAPRIAGWRSVGHMRLRDTVKYTGDI